METIKCPLCLSSNCFEQIDNYYHCNDCYKIWRNSDEYEDESYFEEEVLGDDDCPSCGADSMHIKWYSSLGCSICEICEYEI